MKIFTKAIVSNSEMIKNYKACREKAESFGKIFVLKNNQPDAVLLSIDEYERISVFIEYLERLDSIEITMLADTVPTEVNRKMLSFDTVRSIDK